MRRSHDAPSAVAKSGWRYHHLGIPHALPRANERHLKRLRVHVCGFETSPYGIEWMRFEPRCPVPEIVKTIPHLAFAVDDLDAALEGKEILIAPNAPSAGVRVAFILDDGAPIELLEFEKAGLRRQASTNVGSLRSGIRGIPVMNQNLFLDRNSPPTTSLVSQALGSRASYLDELKRHVPRPLTEEWKYYGKTIGWTLKLLLGKRNLCFIVVCRGYLGVSFVFGDKAVRLVEESDLPSELVQKLVGAKRYAEGRGIRLELKSRRDLEHAKALLDIKRQ